MLLSKEENVIKEWKYAVSKKGVEKTEASLVVTNKRVVHDVKNYHSISRTEIPLKEVKSVDFASNSKVSIGAILSILFGVVLAIVGFILMGQKELSGIAIIPIILGVVLVVVGIIGLSKSAFVMVLYGDRGFDMLNIGASAIKTKRRKRSKKTKIKVDKKVAAEIIDSLGAIILDAQAPEVKTVEAQ